MNSCLWEPTEMSVFLRGNGCGGHNPSIRKRSQYGMIYLNIESPCKGADSS